MSKVQRSTTLQRAKELARSGEFLDLSGITLRLLAEGYPDVHHVLAPNHTRLRLLQLCLDAQAHKRLDKTMTNRRTTLQRATDLARTGLYSHYVSIETQLLDEGYDDAPRLLADRKVQDTLHGLCDRALDKRLGSRMSASAKSTKMERHQLLENCKALFHARFKDFDTPFSHAYKQGYLTGLRMTLGLCHVDMSAPPPTHTDNAHAHDYARALEEGKRDAAKWLHTLNT